MTALVARDLALAFRSGGGAAQGIAFYFVLVLLVPLGVGPDVETLARIAPGTLWIGALLATLLSLDRLFQADAEDGTLDILALSSIPLEGIVAAKALAHWLSTALPLLVVAPVLGLLMGLPPAALPKLAIALALGTPALSLLGAFGAALTLGLRRGGLLLSVLVLPLFIPTLIFGTRAAGAVAEPGPALAMVGAVSLAVAATVPFAAAYALRINLR